MLDPSKRPPDDDLTAPRRLMADLSALYNRSVAIPPAIDDAILSHARSRITRMHQMRLMVRWGGGAAAAAAVLLIALRLAPSSHPSTHVTILDAFSLARQLKSGTTPNKSWDINGDGVVDQKDVEALAAKAVQLPKGGVP